MLRAFLIVSFVLAYVVASVFYYLFKSHLGSWSVGYWTAVAIIVAAAPYLLSMVVEVV